MRALPASLWEIGLCTIKKSLKCPFIKHNERIQLLSFVFNQIRIIHSTKEANSILVRHSILVWLNKLIKMSDFRSESKLTETFSLSLHPLSSSCCYFSFLSAGCSFLFVDIRASMSITKALNPQASLVSNLSKSVTFGAMILMTILMISLE